MFSLRWYNSGSIAASKPNAVTVESATAMLNRLGWLGYAKVLYDFVQDPAESQQLSLTGN